MGGSASRPLSDANLPADGVPAPPFATVATELVLTGTPVQGQRKAVGESWRPTQNTPTSHADNRIILMVFWARKATPDARIAAIRPPPRCRRAPIAGSQAPEGSPTFAACETLFRSPRSPSLCGKGSTHAALTTCPVARQWASWLPRGSGRRRASLPRSGRVSSECPV